VFEGRLVAKCIQNFGNYFHAQIWHNVATDASPKELQKHPPQRIISHYEVRFSWRLSISL